MQTPAEPNYLPDNLDDLRQIAIQEGVPIAAASFQNGLNGMMLRARQYYEAKQKNKRERPDGYLKARNFMLASRDVIAMLVNFFLVVVGIPVSIVALYVSEVLGVHLGIATFLSGENEAVAWALAVTTITAYFALLWYQVAAYKLDTPTPETQWSFRVWIDRLKYIFGLKPDKHVAWQPQFKAQKTRTRQAATAIRWLTLLIVLLGVLGRLDGEEAMNNGTWISGLTAIVTQSTLSELMTYFGGGFISFALLVATHYLIHFVYDAYGKAVGATETDFFSEDESAGLLAAENDAAIQYYKTRIMANRQAKQLPPTT